MKTVAESLGVSRSNLVRRSEGTAKPRGRYDMEEDGDVLLQIRGATDDRATYGYRRIAAIVNRKRVALGQPRLNHKRVYRIMKQNNLLLARHTGKPRDGRVHDGQVITIRSNLRWCSDGFEIPCWDCRVVRVTFIIDTCDREIIAWGATTAGFDGETVRDMMVIAVERRFQGYKAPHAIEFLTDNGSCYTAKEAIATALKLGLEPCFTPVRSPESNGMAEAYVKTFKRDYVYVHDRPDVRLSWPS